MLILILIAAVCLFLWHAALLAFIVSCAYGIAHTALYLWHHPWQTVVYSAGYLLLGAGWSVVKWWSYVGEKIRNLRANHDRGFAHEPWASFVARHEFTIDAGNYKSEISLWILFWPVNALWTIFDDPIRRIVRRIYVELQGVYKRITDYHLKRQTP